MTRKSLENTLNLVNSTQTARIPVMKRQEHGPMVHGSLGARKKDRVRAGSSISFPPLKR